MGSPKPVSPLNLLLPDAFPPLPTLSPSPQRSLSSVLSSSPSRLSPVTALPSVLPESSPTPKDPIVAPIPEDPATEPHRPKPSCAAILKSPWVLVASKDRARNRPRPQNVTLINGRVSSNVPPELITDHQPLWTNIIVGHFIGDTAPHIGTVHATVNRLWPSTRLPCKIDAQFITPKTVLFKIDNEKLRNYVLKQHFWYISEIPLVVQPWNPVAAESKPDMSAIPMWVDFWSVPDSMFHEDGLLYIGDVIGLGIKLHPHTLRCTRLDRARVMVEMNLNEVLPTSMVLDDWPDLVIPISYPWLPPHCKTCSTWGHIASECSAMKGKCPLVGSRGDSVVPTTGEPPRHVLSKGPSVP